MKIRKLILPVFLALAVVLLAAFILAFIHVKKAYQNRLTALEFIDDYKSGALINSLDFEAIRGSPILMKADREAYDRNADEIHFTITDSGGIGVYPNTTEYYVEKLENGKYIPVLTQEGSGLVGWKLGYDDLKEVLAAGGEGGYTISPGFWITPLTSGEYRVGVIGQTLCPDGNDHESVVYVLLEGTFTVK